MAASIDFNGASNIYDSSSDTTGHPLDITGPMTVAAWIQPDTGSGTIVGRRDDGGAQIQYQFYIISGNLVFATTSSGAAGDSAGGAITANGTNIYHVAATLDSDGDVDIFRDGVNIGNFPNSRTITAYNIDTAIGSRWQNAPTIGFPFDGRIGHVHIFDRQLSLSEINEIMWRPTSLVNGLVGYWPLYNVSYTDDVSETASNMDSSVGTPADSFVGFPVFIS